MKNKGFTLVELIAVITIIGILVLTATSAVTKYIDSSKQSSRENTLHEVEDAALSYGLTLYMPDTCGTNKIIQKESDYTVAGCTLTKVKVETLIKNGFLKDEGNLTKRSAEVYLYKYDDPSTPQVRYELKAYVGESVLNEQ